MSPVKYWSIEGINSLLHSGLNREVLYISLTGSTVLTREGRVVWSAGSKTSSTPDPDTLYSIDSI